MPEKNEHKYNDAEKVGELKEFVSEGAMKGVSIALGL
jgi:hypothetical protein